MPVPATLHLYALSEAFSSIWSPLAQECGLALEIVARDGLAGAQLCVVAAGGEEPQLEAALAEVGRDAMIAAVGALPDRRVATAAVRAGAAEYFALPEDYDSLRSWLRDAADRLRARAQRSVFASDQAQRYRFDGILGESRALTAALEQAARVIPHARATVLIAGETGTGKELLARAIHYNGPRREGPFVDINCAAIPENLLESELFGHEKGAFTGAASAKPGLFEEANGGTLFLDEIGHLALPLQGKLLRALEERRIRRVGGTRSFDVDVRVIAASHVDLAAAVRRGEFREDLYWRLNVVQLTLPPLRTRREDILVLTRHFLDRFAEEYGTPPPRLTPAAERALQQRDWGGNIRELRNMMERAVLLSAGGTILPEHLPIETLRSAADADALELSLARASAAAEPPPGLTPDELAERDRIIATLASVYGNQTRAAELLGISRRWLTTKMARYRVPRPRKRDD